MPDHELVLFNFILVSTIITAIIGLAILTTISYFENFGIDITGKTISLFVGFLLLFTGVIQLKKHSSSRRLRKETSLANKDSFVLGAVQGLATLPGLSRSGITISTLLLRKFDDTTALKLSFLMSLPVVLLGNIALNYNEFSNIFSSHAIYGLLASFVFGLATIHALMKVSRKINFGWFAIIFAVLMIVSVLV